DAPRRMASYDLGATGWVARHRERLVIDDITNDDRIMDGEWLERWGLTAYAAYPVLAGDELLAILAFLNSTPIRVGEDAADVVDMFLAQASVAVRNAQLYREAQRRRDVAETLARVALLTRDSIVGALALGDRRGREFSADELQALQAFADQAALALENARLYAAAQESLARLRETQAQLVQAAKMSALGQLVSGVAHELNNPLSVIIGYGQLLLSRDVSPTLKRPLELMVSQGDRMAKIVRNLLYFARQRKRDRAS